MTNRNQEFSVACLKGDLLDIRSFIEDPDFDINAGLDNTNSTGLILAARNGQYETIKLLVTAGADVNRTDNHGSSALHFAALQGNERITRSLLAGNANVDLADEEGCTPLMRAAAAGHLHVLLPLLDAGSLPNKTDDRGNTALLHGAYHYWPHVVATLLDYGADINHRNHQNEGAWDCLDHKHRKSLAIRINKTRKVLDLAEEQQAYITGLIKDVKDEDVLSSSFNDKAGSAHQAFVQAAASDRFGAYLSKMIHDGRRPDIEMLTKPDDKCVSAMTVLLSRGKFNELCRADLWTGQEDQFQTLQKEVLKGWQKQAFEGDLISVMAQIKAEKWAKNSSRPKLKTRRRG